MSNHYSPNQRCPDCSGYEFEPDIKYDGDMLICKNCRWHGHRGQLTVGHKLQEQIIQAFIEGNEIKDIASSYGISKKDVAVELMRGKVVEIIKEKISQHLKDEIYD